MFFLKCILLAQVERFLFSGGTRYQQPTMQHGMSVLGSPFAVSPKGEQVIGYFLFSTRLLL